nr:fibropellin-1-like isoform X4 [Crassostrea gigas]
MYIWPTVTFFALIPCVLSNHFRGGLLTWKAVNESQILVSHRVSYVFSYCSSPQSITLNCFNGCTGSVVMHANCTESNSIDNWADFLGETVFDINNSTSAPIDLRFASSNWMALTQPISATSWSLKMTVDLSLRSDTGNINRSPVSSMASSVTYPCTNFYVYIPVADFDGDVVRCRFASGSDECASVCSDHSSYMTLENTKCRFSINAALPSGNYAVALQIEDFTDSSSTVPLSSVPLQFIFTVGGSSSSCSLHSYFVLPTPSHGDTLQSQNGSLQFFARVRVHFHSGIVTKFHVMSPLTFTISAITQPVEQAADYQVTMSLESDANNVIGSHVVCFSSEISARNSSPTRCITVNITDTDDCRAEPCQNNGTCTDLFNDYQCDCVAGFNGTNCENNIDECSQGPCQNNGTCTDLVNDYHCGCVAGFNETNCENNIDECASQPCQNNGTCIDLINDYQCNCTDGFNGTNCENGPDIDDCLPNPCQNNGTCTDLVNNYQCSCVAGFNGTNCENNMDECTPQPCQNNGTCTDLINGYQCNCTDGFNGTDCENDINDCLPNPCQNNGTCTDLVNDYQCGCLSGFNGTNCENNMDDCASQPCKNNGTCIDLINDYQCYCIDGFNRTNCAMDIDDCNPEPCQNNGTCTDLVNDYQCSCVAGFNGTNCENNMDECTPQPCQNNGTCTDLINGYQCNCTDGFNGTDCENDINDCLPNPCQNNGTCTDLVNNYQCGCLPGFNGTNCENNMDECTPQPCQNNGTCTDLIDGYQCNCTDGFNGTSCENDINDCLPNPCQNNGTCTDLVNNYQCGCLPGFNGTNCDNNVDECASQPCQNSGTCIDLINGYQCDCTDGFNGTDCEFDVILCAPSPCKNNGTCIELINRFQCQCPVEFNGTTCSTESYLTKFTMELKIDVTISEDLSSSTDYNTVKSKVHIALTEMYSTIPGSTVIIHSLRIQQERKGSLIVDFDLIIPDDPVYKVQVVDTVYKLVNGLAFVNYSGEVVNVTSASFNSSAGTVIITNSTDGCSIMNSQSVCSPGYRCHEFNNYTVACIPIINCMKFKVCINKFSFCEHTIVHVFYLM